MIRTGSKPYGLLVYTITSVPEGVKWPVFTSLSFVTNLLLHTRANLNDYSLLLGSVLFCTLYWSIDRKATGLCWYFCVACKTSGCLHFPIRFSHFKLFNQLWTLIEDGATPCLQIVCLQTWTEAFREQLPESVGIFSNTKCWQELRKE